jgi:hypothetical protein
MGHAGLGFRPGLRPLCIVEQRHNDYNFERDFDAAQEVGGEANADNPT